MSAAGLDAVSFASPLTAIRGVGPARARILADGVYVNRVGELLAHLPRRYEDLRAPRSIAELEAGDRVLVEGRIEKVRKGRPRGPRTLIEVTLHDGSERMRALFFGQGWVAGKLEAGALVRLYGKVRAAGRARRSDRVRLEMAGPRLLTRREGVLEPVYPLGGAASQPLLRRTIRAALQGAQAAIRDAERLPAELREKHGLPTLLEALVCVHGPADLKGAETARRRLAYGELLRLELRLAVRRARELERESPAPIRVSVRLDARIRRRLPFRLTPGQDAAVAELVADLASGRPMRRLLLGDVGSGKTAIAVYVMLAACAQRLQCALLAPTEVLARQHHRKITRYLQGAPLRVALLYGGMPAAERRAVIEGLASGRIHLAIGTHALLSDDVRFARLGVSIVDEQHRFGVRERAKLAAKGMRAEGKPTGGEVTHGKPTRGKPTRRTAAQPHLLAMSATPIPRSLALALHGDLDVTRIFGMPPGRTPVNTRIVEPGDESPVWEHLRAEVTRGRRGYIVHPLVESVDPAGACVSAAADTKRGRRAAVSELDRLRRGPLRGVSVALLHGRQPRDEKSAAMADFVSGRASVLVTTTVVEVGVDVPEATVIVIQDAAGFGLAQLHQLRGRVGRGAHPGTCYLLLGRDASDEARERLSILSESTCGFEVAAKDLAIRGPGEFLGTRQAGDPGLRVASLVDDAELVEAACRDARELVHEWRASGGETHRALLAWAGEQTKPVGRTPSASPRPRVG